MGAASRFSLDMKSEMPVTHLIARQAKQGSRCADVGLAKRSLQALSPRVPETGKREKCSEKERWPSMHPEELSTLRGQAERSTLNTDRSGRKVA